MRILILALGSNGDITPCAALGGALAQRGHSVRLATHSDFENLARENGLAFTSIAPSSRDMVARAGIRLDRMIAQFVDLANEMTGKLSNPELLSTDLILNQLPGGLFGMDLAEKAGIPMVGLAYLPILPTGAFPAIGWPLLPWRAYNRFTYRVAEGLVRRLFQAPLNQWRKNVLGLPPLSFIGRLHELGSLRFPWLAGFSPRIIPPPRDWGEYVHVTGYWHPPEGGWQPDAGLSRFLESSPPPLFIGFGSMAVPDPDVTTQMVLEALRLSGQRAVLHVGWGGLGECDLPASVHAIRYAPYNWLFPRCAGAVIHGGSGAVHCVARAGIPALVVPFLFDQFDWGRRLHTLNAGPSPLPFKGLTAQRLAKCLNDIPAYQVSAAGLGNAVRREDGLAEAVRILEGLSR
jgi:sterol 3beta-glucosyltransferase